MGQGLGQGSGSGSGSGGGWRWRTETATRTPHVVHSGRRVADLGLGIGWRTWLGLRDRVADLARA